MRASLWIVTYNNREDLHNNLRSLFLGWNPTDFDLEVNIINNHSNFELDFEYLGKVRVWHNRLRSDNSLGHLARNWNQALIHGFGSLVNPQADIVITSQDDVLWSPQWSTIVSGLLDNYNFVTQGVGDAVIVQTADATRAIGLWDERFCPSFYHDGDYFLRALIHNRARSSINDPAHGRLLNTIDASFATVPAANQPRVHAKNLSYGRAQLPHLVWMQKWPVSPIHWDPEMMGNPPSCSMCLNYITYPHFEYDVDDLKNKNYLV
jgi:hypothetical protein